MKTADAAIGKYCAVLLFVLTCTGTRPSGVEAKTLYVNSTTGSDAASYATNSAASPWRTIGRAAWGSTNYAAPNGSQAAQAGDIVLIAAGTYWEGGDTGGSRFTVSLNPVNSGTLGNPITFRGEGMVQIRLLASYRGAMIGCASRDYIVWDHFVIDDYYGGSKEDTGPVVFYLSHHCELINSEVIAHRGAYYHSYPIFDANYRGVSLEPAYFTVIRNNRIHGFTGASAGIMAYDTDDSLIEHNEVYNSKICIYLKGMHAGRTMARNVIRLNYVHDCARGIQTESAQDTLISQNLVVNSSQSGFYAGALGGPTRSRFINNTVSASKEGSVSMVATYLRDVEFLNNIFVNAPAAYSSWNVDNPGLHSFSADRNLYYKHPRHADYTGGPVSFSQMQRTYGKDASSIEGSDPMFVNVEAGNFRLKDGSPARSVGRDVLGLNRNGSTLDTIPAGAYVTGTEVIGPLSQSAVPQ